MLINKIGCKKFFFININIVISTIQSVPNKQDFQNETVKVKIFFDQKMNGKIPQQ